MKKLIFTILIFAALSCEKDYTEPSSDGLICVECYDRDSGWITDFCGTEDEANDYIFVMESVQEQDWECSIVK